MGTGIIHAAGVPVLAVYEQRISSLVSNDLRQLVSDVLGGTPTRSRDGVAEIAVVATNDADVWNLVLRDPGARYRVVLTLRALGASERVAFPGADPRDPLPAPWQWRVGVGAAHRRARARTGRATWELFNCEVVRWKLE